jgi:hypothetical protein
MLIAIACALSLACGGGGGGFVPQEGLTVTFTPANAAPGAMTISMGQPTVIGESFQVPIVVTGIDDFFGAGFRVNFDPATARFLGYVSEIDTDYFIEEVGVNVLIDAASGGNGVVLITATRQQGGGGVYVPGVTPAAPDNVLIVLNFRATGATAANAFTFSDQEVRACDDGTMTCPVVDPASLTWSGGTMVAN